MSELDAPRDLDADPPRGSLRLPQAGAHRPRRGFSAIASSFSAAGEAAFDRRRTLVLLPFFVIAGIIAYRIWPGEPARLLYGLLGTIVAGLFVAARFGRAGRIATFSLAVLLGFVALPLQGTFVGTPMLDRVLYGPFEGRVERVIGNDGESQRLLVSNLTPLDPDDVTPSPRLVRLTLDNPMPLGPGDRISGTMRIYPVPGPIVPGGYDAQFTSYFDGIGAYANLFGDVEVTTANGFEPLAPIEGLRAAIAQRIYVVLGDRTGGIAVALITGDQSNVTEEDRDVMALAGLAHVLSISGLHLTLVAGTVYWLVRLLLALMPGIVVRVPIKKLAAVFGLAAAFGYLMISGMAIPAIRSTLMLTLVFGAILLGRRALTMRNVALAALVVLVVDPASIFSASFQLSFAAVVALIAAVEWSQQRPRDETRGSRPWWFDILWGTTMTSIVAGAATALFTAYHFQQTAPLGVFGNVIAMPLISFVMMPAALVGVLAMPFGLEALPLLLMGWTIEATLAIATWVGNTGQGYDPSPVLAPLSLVLLLAGLAWLAFFEGPWRFAGPVAAVVLVFTVGQEPRPDVLIADGTQAIALRQGGGMTLVAGRINTFATNVWSERYIEPIESVDRTAFCDEIGCAIPVDPYGVIALPAHPAAVRDDCGIATLVIARFTVAAPCRLAAQVIDAEDLARGGAHAAYWHPDIEGFRIRPTIDDPSRPWRIPPPD